MRYILLLIVIIIIDLNKYFAHWNSAFELRFYLGHKGSGKSTCLVKEMMRYHKKGYRIYTNIESISFPWANIIKIEDLGDYVARPKSYVALDEVGIYYDARKWKQFKDSTRDYYKYQRQYKNIVSVNSQVWDVDKKIKSLCDVFYYCSKIGPFSIARQFKLGSIFTSSEDAAEDTVKWVPFGWIITYIPKYAKHFKSFNPPPRPWLDDAQSTRRAMDHLAIILSKRRLKRSLKAFKRAGRRYNRAFGFRRR